MCEKIQNRKAWLLFVLMVLSCEMYAQNKVKSFDTTELNISEGQSKLASTTKAEYARVNMKRTIPSGQWTAIVMPANLDAYYFGVAAKRYAIDNIVKPTGEDVYYIAYSPMTDADGFKAGQPYLIKPTMDISEINFVTPAVMTKVDKDIHVLYCLDVTGYIEGTPDAIRDIMARDDAEAGGIWYDLLGRPVSTGKAPARAGIYIHKGERVMITK